MMGNDGSLFGMDSAIDNLKKLVGASDTFRRVITVAPPFSIGWVKTGEAGGAATHAAQGLYSANWNDPTNAERLSGLLHFVSRPLPL
jgi:hypothetical protein